MEVDQPRTSERDGASYVGQRIAKEFDGGRVYRGTVRYYVPSDGAGGSGPGSGLWHVVYEDDDEEDLNADELRAAMRLAAAAAGDGAAGDGAASGANANANSSSGSNANSSSSRTSNAFADEVERIVQSAEGRELSAAAADGGVGGGGGGSGSSPPVGSPPARITGAGAPGGPLAAAEIGRLSVLCASLEQQQPTGAGATAAASSAAANNPLRQTDAEAAHSVLPGAAASDDDGSGAAYASDACPPLSGWAGVDGDVLAQLIPMLERHVRSASNVDLVGEARAVAEHAGGGGGGRKKKKAKAAAAGGSCGGSSGEDDEDGGNGNNNNKAATVGEVRYNWELVSSLRTSVHGHVLRYLCMYVDVVGVGRSMISFCFCWLVDRTAVPISRLSRRDLLSIDHDCHT